MKTNLFSLRKLTSAQALLTVLVIVAVALAIMVSALQRTYVESTLNNRNNQFIGNLNAAEAAMEKIYASVANDFGQSGLSKVTINLGTYPSYLPTATDDPYFGNFDYMVTVKTNGTLGTNTLPSQYADRIAVAASPIYRVIVNTRCKTGMTADMTNAVQEDILLALVPLSQFAIFYNGLLEFTKCAKMEVRGPVHANGKIYYGSSQTLKFYNLVTSSDTISAPTNDGYTPPNPLGNYTFFYGGSVTGTPVMTISVPMTNSHALIEMPTDLSAAYANSSTGKDLLFSQANVVLLISNTTVTAKMRTGTDAYVAGADPSPATFSSTNTVAALATNFNFLVTTNQFVDQREDGSYPVVKVSQIDVGKLTTWFANNSVASGKFTSGKYPTVLFVADFRTDSSNSLFAVRLTNGVTPPSNNGIGFSIATPNPLYVWGNYNCPSNSTVGNTNTWAAGTVPCALMSDALTLLSSSWQDSLSSGSYTSRDPSDITVNAAILTGNVPTSTSDASHNSGGVHNLPRLLEDWNGASKSVTLNTSIISLFASKKATNLFINPGDTGCYYSAPTRYFSFDTKFYRSDQQPPGMPCALVPMRYNWAQPPPNNLTYNVTP